MPEGYYLQKIIVTTYDLDLSVLREQMRIYPDADWTVICDGSGICDTENASADISGYETVIMPVEMPMSTFRIAGNPARLAFHPKIRLLVYGNRKGNRMYRLSVGSRNMTRHNNIECEICAEGYLSDTSEKRNSDLIFFFRNLEAFSRSQKKIPEEFLSELSHVAFEPVSEIPLKNFEILFTGAFYPAWHNAVKDKLDVMLCDYDELLIISPNLSDRIIQRVRDSLDSTRTCTVITCKKAYEDLSDELKASPGSRMRFEFYQNETYRLHAKAYFSRKGECIKGYIGSRNATEVARLKTLEAMAYFETEASGRSIRGIADCFVKGLSI